MGPSELVTGVLFFPFSTAGAGPLTKTPAGFRQEIPELEKHCKALGKAMQEARLVGAWILWPLVRGGDVLKRVTAGDVLRAFG